MPEIEVTILGTSFLEPILLLWKKLNESNFLGYNEIRKSMNENGYSCSIISLGIFCMESFITRMRYIDGDNLSVREITSFTYFKNKYSSEQDFIKKITEIFVLRDLIAHNHLWEINYGIDDKFREININKNNMSWNDSKFNRSVDLVKEKTNLLGLEIIPTKIGKEDVKKVLIALKEFLDFISSKDNRYCSNALYSELKEVVESFN